ncbi:MAG TPA: SDR family oxidoreductase [Thermohalobaculum sp.]|nr:SDR family oxidoreductase [Thermohalobaculum sp.]
MAKNPVLLSFGHGYSAQALARRLMAKGWKVIGTTRSEEKAAAIRATGAEAVIWPPVRPGPLLDRATHVLVSAAPSAAGDPVLHHCAGALGARADQFDWLGYLSTTGVYGDRGGDWVDERSDCSPATERGRWRLAAEREWLAYWHEAGLPVHVFRLAGIYGPGRGPFEKVRDGSARRIVKPGQVFSRIHVEDIATVLEASIDRPHPGAIYNVCDDEAAPPEDVIAHAAELLGLPVPPEVPYAEAEMTAMARSFYAESKRVSNAKIKQELKVKLAYPTYREGLAALLADQG